MTWTAKYHRYRAVYTEDFDEEHRAVNFLLMGEVRGDLSSDSVLHDGVVVHDFDGIRELFDELDWQPMRPTVEGVSIEATRALPVGEAPE